MHAVTVTVWLAPEDPHDLTPRWFVDVAGLGNRTTTIERGYASAQEAETDVFDRFPEETYEVTLRLDVSRAIRAEAGR